MKIVNVFSSLDFGGVESRACIINRYGENHSFVAISKGGMAERNIAEYGGDVTILSCSSKICSSSAIFKLYFFFLKAKPDVVHCRGAEANFHGLLAAWLARVPVRIAEEIGIPSHGKTAKIIFGFVYTFAHRIVAISDSVKTWLVKSGEVKEQRVVRIYNPVDLDIVNNEPDIYPKSNKFKIGFVGRLEKVKNPLSLIEAVRILNDKGVPIELYLVGDGSLKGACESLVSKLKLNSKVKIIGYSPDPCSYVSRCDLYVQPSLSEGFGLALVEAMGCGVPVLATAVGGAPEIITHNVTGWLVEDSSPSSLANAIYNIWINREGLAEVGKKGFESVKNRFEPQKYISELDSLYFSILNSDGQL